MKDLLTPDMLKFLRRLARFTQPETRSAIGPVTSRAEELARAACRRHGYARMERRADGKWGWRITAAGRKMAAWPSPTPLAAEVKSEGEPSEVVDRGGAR